MPLDARNGLTWPGSSTATCAFTREIRGDTLEGLTPNNHGPYCRAPPEGVPRCRRRTIRTHGESGVAEGTYEFRRMVFDGVARAGRGVANDLHATFSLALGAPSYTLRDVNDWLDGQGLSAERLVPQTSTLGPRALGGDFALPSS